MALSFRVTVPARQLGARERKLARRFRRSVEAAMKEAAGNAVDDLKAQVDRRGVVFRGRFKRGWQRKKELHGRYKITNRAKHAIYIEKGRRRGAKPPPVRALRAWARAKLGNANLAYPVAKSIAKKGIRPKKFITSQAWQRKARRMFRRTLQKHLDKAFREAYK